MYPSTILQETISEYFRLYDLCQILIIGLVEDERVFNALQFIKSNYQNILDKKLSKCLRLYVLRYVIDNFPYDRAMSIWQLLPPKWGVTQNVANEIET